MKMDFQREIQVLKQLFDVAWKILNIEDILYKMRLPVSKPTDVTTKSSD